MPALTTFDSRSEKLPHEAKPLDRVGEWNLDGLLAAGKWADVYRCSPVGCASQQSDYVMKRIRSSDEADSLAVDFLRKEASLGRKVSHPSLAPVLAAHISQPPYYLVMPYLAGRTLKERLLEGESICLPHALWIARQICEALVALHAVGWFHCDVKPENIFVADSGHTILLDLGLAQSVRRPIRHDFVGTPDYAAPEWWSSERRVSPACDIYSLGVTLLEILTGVRSKRPASGHSCKKPHRRTASKFNSLDGMPISVARLLQRMLFNEPLRRPSGSSLVDELCGLEIEFLEERLQG